MNRDMLFGLSDGHLIQLEMKDEEAVYIWSLQASEDSGINQVKVFDMNGNGNNEM